MKKGFTLIELLIVVLIIGILSAVALPQYQKAVTKSKVASFMPLFRSIANAEESYYMANGAYTANYDELALDFPSGTQFGRQEVTLPNGIVIAVRSSGYMAVEINKEQSQGAVQLNYWFEHGIGAGRSFQCFAANTDSLGNAICKSFSSTGTFVNGDCTARGVVESCKGYSMR